MPECPRCGSPHDSLDGVAVHAWKTQDEDHSDIDSKDEGMRIAIEEEYSKSPEGDGEDYSNSDSGSDSKSGGSDPTLDDGPPPVEDVDGDDADDEGKLEAPCGCHALENDLVDGKVYECTEHGKRFKYTA